MEKRIPKKTGIIEQDSRGNYYSVIGNSRLPISKEVGKTISSLLRIQSNLSYRNYESSVLKIWLMLNCRKTIDFIRGGTSLKDLTNQSSIILKRISEIPYAMSNGLIDRAGIIEMFKDLSIFSKTGRRPILFGSNNNEAGFLDSEFYSDNWLESVLAGESFPQTVHIFEFVPNTPLEVKKRFVNETHTIEDFTKLGFTHTIEVLGKAEDGTIHCVHKEGPKQSDKVVIMDHKSFQKWLRFGSNENQDVDLHDQDTFVAIGGRVF